MSLIFIVDDSSLSRNTLSRLLEEEGHKVICLGDSIEASDMIIEAKPDLLLLDVVMPRVSGIELLRNLKSKESLATMPIIMVTARTGSEDLREALDAGAFDYVRKPVDPIEVLARVRSALRTCEYTKKLLYLAERDGLTGLLNHKTILRELDTALAGLESLGSCLALVMCDIDFFKKINDEYGHQAGDEVLSGIGSILSNSQGATCLAGRYGGEEFCIILGGFDRAMAVRWAEAIRSYIETREWDAGDRALRFTMSFGIAWTEGGAGRVLGARELLAEADRRLYAAKKAGRNRVVSTDEA